MLWVGMWEQRVEGGGGMRKEKSEGKRWKERA
jgi:hypothetical protein